MTQTQTTNTKINMTRAEYRAMIIETEKQSKANKRMQVIRRVVGGVLIVFILASGKVVSASPAEEYKIQKGDNWYKLSQKSGVSVSYLKEINDKTNDRLNIDEVVYIPDVVDFKIWVNDTGLDDKKRAMVTSKVLKEIEQEHAAAKKETKKEIVKVEQKKTVGTIERTVKAGDNWYKFSLETGTSVKDLMKLNGKTSDALRVNEKVQLPASKNVSNTKVEIKKPVTEAKIANTKEVQKPISKNAVEVTVKKNDNLWKIAREYRTTVEKIQKDNGLKNTKLKIGQKLKISGVTHVANSSLGGVVDSNFVEFKYGNDNVVLKVTPFFNTEEFSNMIDGQDLSIKYNEKTLELISFQVR